MNGILSVPFTIPGAGPAGDRPYVMRRADERHREKSAAKKAGAMAARAWGKSARTKLLKLAGYEFAYGSTLDELRSRGLDIPPSADVDFSWGFFKQAKSRVHHALHRVKLAGREKAKAAAQLSGFNRLNRTLREAQRQLSTATSEEQFQAVGLFCREALISLAQAVYDPERHPPLDDMKPSTTDTKRMLDAFFAKEMEGPENKVARSHARTAVDLALELQHRRTADRQVARRCLDATTHVAKLVQGTCGHFEGEACRPGMK